MSNERTHATKVIDAPADVISAVLADPSKHAAIDGTGWVREPLDTEQLTAANQVFRMAMFHAHRQEQDYVMANCVRVFEPSVAISWDPRFEAEDGTRSGGWTWRYDLSPIGPSQTEVTLSYDWSAVPEFRQKATSVPPIPARASEQLSDEPGKDQ